MEPIRRSVAVPFMIGMLVTAYALRAEEPADGEHAEDGGEVIALFDGQSLAGWTNASGDPVTKGWTVEEGALVRTGRGGAIYAEGEYDDFVLEFEWKIAPRGNSGVKYRVRFYEKGVRGRPGWLGCEYQLFDDAKRPSPKSSAGALYSLYAPNDKKHLSPAGEYNRSRIVVCGTRIEHWLNGEKIVEADTSSEDWQKRIAQSKFAPVEDFAQNRKGRIQIQDHGSKIWFRSITLRRSRAAETRPPHAPGQCSGGTP